MIEDSPGSLLSEFYSAETANTTGITASQNLIDLTGLNPSLPYHKIFLYQETARSVSVSADYFVRANVTLWRGGTPSVILPAAVGQDNNNSLLSQSIFSLFPCLTIITAASRFVPCVPAQESITVTLGNSFSGGAQTVVLGFARVTGIIDRITYSVTSFGSRIGLGENIIGSRALLGILSSVNPF